MNKPFKLSLAAVTIVLGLGMQPAHAADSDFDLASEAKRTDRIAKTGESAVVVDRMAEDFSTTFGSVDETRQLINDLRDGNKSVKPQGKIGYGEIYILLALTQAYATANSLSIDAAMDRIISDRKAATGWGKIAHDLGINLGLVIAQLRSGNERLATAVHNANAARTAKTDRDVTKSERPQHPDRPQRPAKPERPERPGKS